MVSYSVVRCMCICWYGLLVSCVFVIVFIDIVSVPYFSATAASCCISLSAQCINVAICYVTALGPIQKEEEEALLAAQMKLKQQQDEEAANQAKKEEEGALLAAQIKLKQQQDAEAATP